LVAAFLASWLGVAILVADGANFPIPVESRQGISGLVALIPVVIAVIALFASNNLRAINAATPGAWLIAIQTYRIAGVMFMYPFVTYGILPAGFGSPSGIGDALTWRLSSALDMDVRPSRYRAGRVAVSWRSL